METKPRNGHLNEYNIPFIEQRADPFICRDESRGRFYFTASVPEYDRIVLRCADSVEDLRRADEKTVWTAHESGEMSHHIWAPELHYLFDRWYIYFAAGERDNIWKIRPYVLECTGDDPMTGEWRELGRLQRSADDVYSFAAFSLDTTVFEHRGEWYCVWAEKVSVGIGISNLYIARMGSPVRMATAQVLLTTPDYEWERRDIWVNEGPSVIRHNGRLYLSFSASATGSVYCMGLLSIDEDDDLLDPRSWVKERQPVLSTDENMGFYGPGHNSFTEDGRGNTLCVFHARTYKDIEGDPLYDPNRHTFLMRVEWDGNGPVLSYDNIVKQKA